MDGKIRLSEATVEVVKNVLSYVGHHGKSGRWSYDMMLEALQGVMKDIEKCEGGYENE